MSRFNRGLFSSASQHWATPHELLSVLNEEFHFNDDPCPLFGDERYDDGLSRPWGTRTYINPPYGSAITAWVKKAVEEAGKGKLVVALLPARTDTRWFHDYVMKATELRFLRGRLKFGGSRNSAPFPSMVVVWNGCNRE